MLVPRLARAQSHLPAQVSFPRDTCLHGWTIAVTSAGRSEAIIAPLQQRGALVHATPTLQIHPVPDSPDLRHATTLCLAAEIDLVVVTSAHGFRGWLEACDGWGVGVDLRARLAQITVLARGAKASGAVQEAGLVDAARGTADSTWHLLGQLLGMPLLGLRIAVVLHGAPVPDLTNVLRTAGATVVEVPVYRAVAPTDGAGTERLLELIRQCQVQAVTFTSGAATANLLAAAESAGVLQPLLTRLAEDVTPIAVGSVAAAPLERLGVLAVKPEQARLGAVVHVVTETLCERSHPVWAGERMLEVRGAGALVDGIWRPLAPGPMTVLRMLNRRPGHVVGRRELLAAMPGTSGDEHTVEMAVRRLRAGLGDPACIENVMKRGYRLAASKRPALAVIR